MTTPVGSLPAATSIATTDYLPVEQGGVLKRATPTLLPFIASGTGATTRTALAKVRDVVSAKDFGATGDGVTDDAAAIILAAATGKDVYFPAGTYIVNSAIAPTTAGQVFFGEGYQSIIQQGATIAFDIFTPAADGITFRDLRFNGGQSSQSATVYWAIVTDAVANPKYVKVIRCKFSGASAGVGFRGAVKFNASSDYGVVENCDFERLWGSTLDSGYGILTGNVTGCHVINCRGVGSSGRGRHLVYFSAGASDCLAADSYATSFNEAGFNMFSQSTQPQMLRNTFRNCWATSCQIDANSAGAAIQVFGHHRDCKVLGCYAISSGSGGIRIDSQGVTDGQDITVADCTIVNSQLEGLIFHTIVGGVVSGNTIRESSQSSAGVYSNIVVEGDGVTAAANFVFTGNSSTGTSKARSAFQLNSTTPVPTNIRCENNYFPTCQNTDIELGASTVVFGNDIFGSWTPVLSNSVAGDLAVTYSTQVGRYVKSGREVTVWFNIITSGFTWTTSSGTWRITGLPFTANATIDSYGDVVWGGITKATYTQVIPRAEGGQTRISFLASGSGVAAATLNAADMPSAGSVVLIGKVTYAAST